MEKMLYGLCRLGHFSGPHCDGISASPKDTKADLHLQVPLQSITAGKRGKGAVALLAGLQTTPGTGKNCIKRYA